MGNGNRRRAAVGAALAAGLSACSAFVGANGLVGTCEVEHDACKQRCGGQVNPRDCELSCDYESRMCARRENDDRLPTNVDPVVAAPPLGPPQTMAVDLRGGHIEAKGAYVNFDGPARPVDGAYEVDPGASMRLTFPVPADTREVELTLLHASGGQGVNCFVTVAVGDHPILGRYAPPPKTGDGLLRPERWNVSFALPEKAESDPQKVTVFLYNNQAAGSKTPYLIGAAELAWRRPEPAKK
jgi:hypothetical protein